MDIKQRRIRVFVSSTFRDMRAERDELAKRVFPAVKRLCASRGVVFEDVDLRWGITDEAAAEGRVLDICLREIDECRPFFIGILGERYGWIPDDVASVREHEAQRWGLEPGGRSVTELEIIHGVLARPEMAERAHFYFRDPASSHALGPEYMSTSGDELSRLLDLKERVRVSGLPVREGFADAVELGELVREDLFDLVDSLFPPDSEPDIGWRLDALQEGFARFARIGFLPRSGDVEALDSILDDAGPLAVSGAPGSGKTALLSYWTDRVRSHTGVPVFVHFVDAGGGSDDWRIVVRRLASMANSALDLALDIPDESDVSVTLFGRIMHMISARGREAVFAIDGLDGLQDDAVSLDLGWLPPLIPHGVRVVVTARPGGRPAREIERRGWRIYEVPSLSSAEKQVIATGYLARYRKELGPDRLARIIAAPQTANPSFLCTLLDELRLHAEHENLDEMIDWYLESRDRTGLVDRILGRFEQDYERERPGLVGDAMSLIWAARRGLGEAELRDLLGGVEPLPRAVFSPLYLAAEHLLREQAGLLVPADHQVRAAVEARYLPEEAMQTRAHQTLASHFEAREWDGRRIDEAPWQLLWCRDFNGLLRTLSDPAFIGPAYARDQYAVRRLWVALGAETGLTPAQAYGLLADSPDASTASLLAAADLLRRTGAARGSLSLWEVIERRSRASQDRAGVAGALLGKSLCLLHTHRADEALPVLDEQRALAAESGDIGGLQRGLCNTAMALEQQGSAAKALEVWKEQEALCRRLGDDVSLAVCLGNQALLVMRQGAIGEALRLLQEQDMLSRRQGDLDVLQACLGHQALAHQSLGDHARAHDLLREQEAICHELGNRGGLVVALANLATLKREQGDLEEAYRLHEEQRRIAEEAALPHELAKAIGGLGLVAWKMGDLEQAQSLLADAQARFESVGDDRSARNTMGNRAVVADARGDQQGAISLLAEQAGLCREAKDAIGLAQSLANRSVLLVGTPGGTEVAMELAAEAQTLARSTGHPGLIASVDAVVNRVREVSSS
jgi:tetratricopeptide (TPR) repeat protein